MAVYKLNEIAPIQQGTLSENDKYWLLNLDMVESNSGKVLGYNYVSSDQIGASTIAFDTNNVLYSKLRPYLNKVVLPTQNGYATSEMVPLRPNTNIITREYLTYLLRSPLFVTYINSKTSGAKMPRAKLDALKNYEIDCPPIVDQVARTTRLDEIVTAAEICREQIEKYDLLIKSRFVEMFGDLADPGCKWEKCRLVDACVNSDDIKCGPFGTQLGKDEYVEEGVAVWEIPQINSEFKTSPTHFVTEKKAAELDAYSIIPGDIAMSRKGNVGRCAVFPTTFENGIIHSDVLRIRLDKTKALPEFMMRQLHYSGDIQHQIELVSSGAIMAGINVTKLKQIFVYLPPTDLQDKFAAFVAQVDKSKAVVQSIMDKLNTLQVSLMQEYFG